ncbi:MAG TPA: CHAD domain-containing protein [Chthonomonadaceae bacterium]|nr:CHAD domain-containing protein [Chthonomonadaceae bacterium]
MAKALPIAGLDTAGPILDSVRLIVETRLGEMLAFEPYLDDVSRIYELHQMRIAAKRLRYSMEIFQPLLIESAEYAKPFSEVTERVKALQEHLGEIHDADVLVPRLEEQMARMLKGARAKSGKKGPPVGVDLVDLDGCQGILRICQDVRRERAARYRSLRKDWALYKKQRVFDNLRDLLREAAEDCTLTGRIGAAV